MRTAAKKNRTASKRRMTERERGLILLIVLLWVHVLTIPLLFHSCHNTEADRIAALTYYSEVDMDGDGIEDQRDVLESAKAYLVTKPHFKIKYYFDGYPDDDCGIAADVIAFALKGAGYDLKTLIDADKKSSPDSYSDEWKSDTNVDFRRTVNQKTFLDRKGISLGLEMEDPADWQAGDIIYWGEESAGILSDARNEDGYPLVLHNSSEEQEAYEEDILSDIAEDLTGRYRIS